MAENSRTSIRNIRRDGNDEFKKLQKNGDLTEDDFLYCALSVLGCKNDKISVITRWSGNAIKSRLYHIKQKMTAELFETLLNS